MAALTNGAFARMLQRLYTAGVGKEELKGLQNLPTKAQLRAAFQSIEDWWDGDQAGVRANVDAALGINTSPTLARKIACAWLEDKLARLRALG